MDKFSKLKPNSDKPTSKKENVLFQNKYVKLIEFDDWSIITGKDCVICIPYLIEQNKFIIRQEYIPTYKYAEGQDFHLACVGGEIEESETPEESLIRELQEEAGIVLRENFRIELEKPLFFNKGCSVKCYYCIITLNENDYHEIVPPTDGSKVEKMSQTAKIDVKYINSLNTSDITTEFMLDKLRKHLNL